MMISFGGKHGERGDSYFTRFSPDSRVLFRLFRIRSLIFPIASFLISRLLHLSKHPSLPTIPPHFIFHPLTPFPHQPHTLIDAYHKYARHVLESYSQDSSFMEYGSDEVEA